MASNVAYKQNFEDFENNTHDMRIAAEKRRDYRDLKQWTDQEVAVLQQRGQAAIVFDQFGKKVDGICGLEVQRRSDPKALPQNPKHEKAADAITDALRYVESHTHFDNIGSEVFEDKIVEGYGGCIVEYDPKKKKIKISQIPWDRIYFDRHSRLKDFSDSTVFGITLWMEAGQAKQRFKLSDEKMEALINNEGDGTTFEDRPSFDQNTKWYDKKKNRVRVNQEYRLKDGVWHEVFFCGDTVLVDEKPSPYLDCDGNPTCPIFLQSDFIDRDNNRYGYTQRLIDPQDEINHRRSKALHMLSNVSIIGDRGAFGDMPREQVLEEAAKGRSFLEPMPGARVEIDHNQELSAGQVAMYQDAQAAMDSIGINPELTGATDSAISGRAFIARQQGGMVELERVFTRHEEWKERVYRACWERIKQFWTEETWVRVTDDENATKFVGLNVPVTVAEKMLEQQIQQTNQAMTDEQKEQFIQMAIQDQPELAQVVEVKNEIPKLSMDITIEAAPDTVSIQQEQFETLAQLAGTRADPQIFNALVELSSLSKKDAVLDKLNGDEQQQAQQAQIQQMQAQIQQMMTQLQMASMQADIENKQADILVKQSTAQKNMADIPLKEAQAKDEMASAMQRVDSVAVSQSGQNNL